MKNNAQAKKYLDDRDYQMKIVLDQGVHRHLEFKHNNSSDGHFNITTWPGHLCISGDMGSYVFSRVHDMVDFFSGDYVNPQYWEEKVQSQSKFGSGCKEFNFDTFHKSVKESLTELLSDEYDEKTREEAKDYLDSLEHVEEDEYGAVEFVRSIHIDDIDTYEWCSSCDEYTFHYLFACHAINFACNTYLAEKDNIEFLKAAVEKADELIVAGATE